MFVIYLGNTKKGNSWSKCTWSLHVYHLYKVITFAFYMVTQKKRKAISFVIRKNSHQVFWMKWRLRIIIFSCALISSVPIYWGAVFFPGVFSKPLLFWTKNWTGNKTSCFVDSLKVKVERNDEKIFCSVCGKRKHTMNLEQATAEGGSDLVAKGQPSFASLLWRGSGCPMQGSKADLCMYLSHNWLVAVIEKLSMIERACSTAHWLCHVLTSCLSRVDSGYLSRNGSHHIWLCWQKKAMLLVFTEKYVIN